MTQIAEQTVPPFVASLQKRRAELCEQIAAIIRKNEGRESKRETRPLRVDVEKINAALNRYYECGIKDIR